MRNIYEVIRQKEAEVQQLQRELEALRLAARLLTDDAKVDVEPPKARVAAVAAQTMSPSVAPSIRTDTEVILSTPLRQFP